MPSILPTRLVQHTQQHRTNPCVRVLGDPRRLLVHDRVHDPRRHALGAQHKDALRHAHEHHDLRPLAPRVDGKAEEEQRGVGADPEVARPVDIGVKRTGGVHEHDPRG